MTEVKAPDLTPPTKVKTPAGTTKAEAPGEVPTKPKKEKVPKEPKASRARGNYGYHPDATIQLTDKEPKYRGQRADWFEIVKAHEGKKVSEFNEACKGRINGKGTVQTPSGWLRFYVLDGTAKLVGGPAAEKTTPDATKAA